MLARLQPRRIATAGASEALADLCAPTCADTTAVGASDTSVTFSCADEINDLNAAPSAVSCSAITCSAAECCTVVPPAAASTQLQLALADAPPQTDWWKVSTSIIFNADIADIPDGSAARVEFEQQFKERVAAALGDGNTIASDAVIIDSIRAASIVIEWHILVPPAAVDTATSLVQSLKDSGVTIEVVVGGITLVAPAFTMETPTTSSPAEDEPTDMVTNSDTQAVPTNSDAESATEGGSNSVALMIGIVAALAVVSAGSMAWRRSSGVAV
jgi:hypothetical protein